MAAPAAGGVATSAANRALATRTATCVRASFRQAPKPCSRALVHYAADCTRDVLLLAHGLRTCFVTDAFAPLSVWMRLLQDLSALDAAAFAPLAVLTLAEGAEDPADDEGASFLLHTHRFRAYVRDCVDALNRSAEEHDGSQGADAAGGADASEGAFFGPEFILVHSSLPSPRLCKGPERTVLWRALLAAAESLLQQLDASVSSSPRCLRLSRECSPLCATALCGFLLGYPLLYCTTDPLVLAAAAATAAAAAGESGDPALVQQAGSSSGNNLGLQPLHRVVLEAELRVNEWSSEELTAALQAMQQQPQLQQQQAGAGSRKPLLSPQQQLRHAAADSADMVSRTLVCSFTVPAALLAEASVVTSLAHWKAAQLSLLPLESARCCWRTPLVLSTQSVSLPFVAL